MAVRDVDRDAVLQAVSEFDRIGRDAFLHKYGFGPARSYLLLHEGRHYDSKAIVGAAHGYALPGAEPLGSGEFSGGAAGAAGVLRRLGFHVEGSAHEELPTAVSTPAARISEERADVVLVGCVKTKGPGAAPAEDLYISPLFRKRRTYAEASGRPWFILSALHGLLAPSDVVEPYDLAMADQSVAYRTAWGRQVVDALASRMVLAGRTFEVHAGRAYIDAIERLLRAEGATVLAPLRGLTQGQHLAWYAVTPSVSAVIGVEVIASALGDASMALPCGEFPWGRRDLAQSGLYSWWVDVEGAHQLSAGLGQEVSSGLVYVGQAGASSSQAGLERASTLLSRVRGNHLGGGIKASTWRRTLTGVLHLEPKELNSWMREHLRLIAVPVPNRVELAQIEVEVLELLDPPLNLAHRPSTPVRRALRTQRGRLT